MNNTGKKFGGRQKGTPNKITSEIRDKISVLDENDLGLAQDMNKIFNGN